MASFNYSTMQMTAKIVYYGPGLGGKTTNLQYIYDHTTHDTRGEMVSLETQTDRTLFFDLLPLEVGRIAGFKTRIQLYTVPGQVFYNTTRKLVLKGVDGVVFVADSQRSMLDANLESFRNLEANLAELGILLDSIPLVLQYNKRDLPNIFSVGELDQLLNRKEWRCIEASAIDGGGVFETLRGISKLALVSLRSQLETAQERPAERAGPYRLRAAAGAGPGTAAPAAAAGGPRPAATGPLRPRPVPTPRPARRPTAPKDGGRAEIQRDLLLQLERRDLRQARTLTIDLEVQDEEDRALRRIRTLRVPLERSSDLEEILLRLNIELAPGD